MIFRRKPSPKEETAVAEPVETVQDTIARVKQVLLEEAQDREEEVLQSLHEAKSTQCQKKKTPSRPAKDNIRNLFPSIRVSLQYV